MMRNGHKVLFVLFIIMAVLSSTAISIYAQHNSWERVQGSAVDIAVSEHGNVMAIDKMGKVFRYNYDTENWTPIGQNMRRIVAGDNETFFGVDRRGNVRRFTGTQWQNIGSGAQNLATGPNGNLYVSTNAGTLALFNVRSKEWQSIEGSGAHIDVDTKGLIWKISADGSLARKLDDAWIGLEGYAIDIDIDKQGRTLIVQNDGRIAEWDENAASWRVIDTMNNVAALSSNDSQIWTAQKNGNIFVYGLHTKNQPLGEGIDIGESGDGGATNPASIVDNSPIVFETLPDNTRLEDLSIGQDGSVFGLTSSGGIERWSNSAQRFNEFPGTLERIKIQDSGLPLGIGTNGNLLEHDGEAWRQVNLSERLVDIAIFKNDRVLAINNDEKAIKISEKKTAFEQLGGPRAQQISATEDGSFWLIDNVNRLFQCTSSAQCERQTSNASDIDIGPAGSVFIVDTNANLRRYNANTGAFDLIRQGNTSRIALGPQDRPWIIDNQGRVLQSGFFERDESGDHTLSIKTTATEDVTTETPNVNGTNAGVQIVHSISFNAITIPTTSPGFPNLGTGLLDITSGRNDVVFATGFSDPCVEGTGLNWLYNPNSNSFTHLDYLQRINIFNAVASETLSAEDLSAIGLTASDTKPPTTNPDIQALYMQWQENCSTPVLITYADSVFSDSGKVAAHDYEDALFDSAFEENASADIDVAANNVVVNVDGINTLRFFQPGVEAIFNNRSDLTFMRVGIGADENDVWVVNNTYNVYELNPSSNQFELRSINADDRAMDVGVGHDGTVFIVNLSGVLKKWDETSRRFIRTNKTGVSRVAVDSRGNPIVANFPDSQTVFFGR